MGEKYYNLPMVRENFVTRNIKKIFQGFFGIKRRRKRKNQKRAQAVNQVTMKKNNNNNFNESISLGARQKVDIYEFQNMYKRGEISIENMNEDQKYALIKLFELQNERLRESIQEHKKNTEVYNNEVTRLKKELEIIK